MPDQPFNLTDWLDEHTGPARSGDLVGIVTKVYEHTETDDDSNHEVNVKTTDELEELRRIPVRVERNGHVRVPRKDDVVVISFEGRDKLKPYVSDFAYTNLTRAPLGRAGHWRHRFGDSSPYLFVEAETSDHSAGAPDVVRLGKKSDGLSDPSTTIEIDDSGASTQVNIDTDGDVNITAGGNIYIDGIDFDEHVHNYSWTDGAGSDTTDGPDNP